MRKSNRLADAAIVGFDIAGDFDIANRVVSTVHFGARQKGPPILLTLGLKLEGFLVVGRHRSSFVQCFLAGCGG